MNIVNAVRHKIKHPEDNILHSIRHDISIEIIDGWNVKIIHHYKAKTEEEYPLHINDILYNNWIVQTPEEYAEYCKS
jgi:hypothetical protein